MKKLLFSIIAAGLGFWLAAQFIEGVDVALYPDSNLFGINLTAQWQLFLMFGIELKVETGYLISGLTIGFMFSMFGAWLGEKYQESMEKAKS